MAKIGKDKYIFGTVKVGTKGQLVIPLEARKLFNIKPGDILLVAGDINKGIALSKLEGLKGHVMKMLGAFNDETEEPVEKDAAIDAEEV